jgi:hypothetical protein
MPGPILTEGGSALKQLSPLEKPLLEGEEPRVLKA